MRNSPAFSQGFINYQGQVILSKSLSLLGPVVSMLIFGGVLLLKVEVWAEMKKAEVANAAAQMDWEGFLYTQTAREVLEARTN